MKKQKLSLVISLITVFILAGFAFSVSAEETAPEPTPICSTDHLSLCTTQELCEGISLYWYNDVCNLEPASVPEPICSTDHLSLCTTQELCDGISLYWYNNVCNLEPAPAEPPTPPAPPAESPQPTLPPPPVYEPSPAPLPVVPPAPAMPSFDPATAPSKVTIRVIMPDGTPPPFPVFVTFVGVGNKNFGGKIDANGELTVVMPSGRYYTNLMVVSTEYVQGEDGPSFFLEANDQRDFGAIKLALKTEQTPQSVEDKTLEADILKESESATGIGKILLLIVKLLMQILEEVKAIAQKMG